jgi:hypothetical protein
VLADEAALGVKAKLTMILSEAEGPLTADQVWEKAQVRVYISRWVGDVLGPHYEVASHVCGIISDYTAADQMWNSADSCGSKHMCPCQLHKCSRPAAPVRANC